MKTKIKLLFTFAVIGVLFIAGRSLGGVKTVKYENGLTSILINNKNRVSASVVVFVRAGAVNELESQGGVSHFLEHLMFKGSKDYPGDLLSRNVENMGGYINAATSKGWTHYYINIPKDGLESAVRMLADTMRNPLFPQEEIDMERKVVIEEIQRHSDNPISVLNEKYYATVYLQSALKNSVLGTAEVIAGVSREEIFNYYKSHYIPEKMVVVVSGNFDEFKIKKLLTETFGKFEKQPVAKDPLLKETAHRGQDVVECGEIALGYMLSGFLGPDITDEDIYIADLAASILGGGKGSRLYRSLYEDKHIVYRISSVFEPEKGSGNICIMSVFEPKNLEKVKDEIKKQIENIIDCGVTQEELNRTKLALKTGWNFSKETAFDIAEHFGYWHLVGNSDFPSRYMEKIESFTSKDVVDFFRKYYSSYTISNVALLPKASK